MRSCRHKREVYSVFGDIYLGALHPVDFVAGFVRGWTWSFFISNPHPFLVNADHCAFRFFSNVWMMMSRDRNEFGFDGLRRSLS
jgi:hypothetical protein